MERALLVQQGLQEALIGEEKLSAELSEKKSNIVIGSVKLGDNISCEIVGTGTVKYLLDGGGKFDQKQVKHVLEIKRNLISVVVQDKDGFSVKVENGLMKVTKWSVIH